MTHQVFEAGTTPFMGGRARRHTLGTHQRPQIIHKVPDLLVI